HVAAEEFWPALLSAFGWHWQMRVDLNQRLIFPSEIAATTLRPDLVLWSNSCRLAYIIELTVPWEDSLEEAYERKKLRYSNFAAEAEDRGWNIRLVARKSEIRLRLCLDEVQPFCLAGGLTPTRSVNTLLHVFVCRRLHCTRNYIHVNLFVSFMLRAVAVLAKDTLLFSEDEATDCSTQPSLVGCKATLVFFNYFVMANFFWLLVEGLYLHTLLLVIHTYSTRLSIYMFIGWGKLWSRTTVALIFLFLTVLFSCWEINDNPVPDRLINWPIMASIIINFILFISIIRVLVQKLRCSEVGGNDQSQYRRLAKSTLLLIPLFGVHYVVFFYLMEPDDQILKQIKIFFDLGLGSFQVRVSTSVLFEGVLRLNKQHRLMQSLSKTKLFCFLHKCQIELRRSLSLKRCVGREEKLQAVTLNRNGSQRSPTFPRNVRAQSILQTETSVL
uniref:G-protein coupled receptors family 2 profile 2 domain-containing protein n=1 Tax=Oryzias latipes TaxID=8090 RepID=A0A3P9HPZ5_ORYLA